MARQGTASTGKFATRGELEAELDRLGATGEFDSAIARATGISSAAVAKYLRSRPAAKRKSVPPRAPEPVAEAFRAEGPKPEPIPEPETVPDVVLVVPLVAEGKRILNSQGELVAEAVDEAMASCIASAINSASALADAMVASSPVAPAADGASPPRRRGGRPRKAATTEPLPTSTADADGGSAPATKGKARGRGAAAKAVEPSSGPDASAPAGRVPAKAKRGGRTSPRP